MIFASSLNGGPSSPYPRISLTLWGISMNTRPQLLGALVALLLSTGAIAAQPAAEKAISIDIASQPIEEALNEFGRQVNLHVVLYSEVARGVHSRQVSGTLTPQEALERLL